jgi:signal transduction histidine kinase
LTLQNERQYRPTVRVVTTLGAKAPIRSLRSVDRLIPRRRLTDPTLGDQHARSLRAERTTDRDAALAVFSALAEFGAEQRPNARHLKRLAAQVARALGASVFTVRLLDASGRWLDLAASVGLPKPLRSELGRVTVDSSLGRRLVRTGRRIVWAHPAPPMIPKTWLLGMARWRGAGGLFPIRGAKKILGVLGVGYAQTIPPPVAIVRLLDAFARQLGVTMHAMRSRETQRRVLEETRTLRRITATLSANVQQHSALDMVAVAAAQLTRSHGAIVMLPSRDRSEFEIASQSDSRAGIHLVGLRFPAADSMAQHVIRAGRPFRCYDAAGAKRSMLRALVSLGGVRGLMIVPLRGADGTIGTLNVCSSVPRHYSDRERRLLMLLGQHASIAIQNARLFEALQSHRQLLRQLYSEQFSILEGERKRIAHELHDEMGPTLSATLINLQLFKTLGRDGRGLATKVDETERLLKGIIEKVRELAYGLRPPMLEHLGLAESLKWMIDTYFSGGTLVVDYRHSGVHAALDPGLALAMYRIAQEALTNVVKHAQAKHVAVRLAIADGRLRLRIDDDGRGFETSQLPSDRRAGLGLASMRERVEHLRGEMDVRSVLGQGCRLSFSCPIEVSDARPVG